MLSGKQGDLSLLGTPFRRHSPESPFKPVSTEILVNIAAEPPFTCLEHPCQASMLCYPVQDAWLNPDTAAGENCTQNAQHDQTAKTEVSLPVIFLCQKNQR